MYSFIDAKAENSIVSDVTISLWQKDVLPVFSKTEFFIPSVPLNAGLCFYVRGMFSSTAFSFTDEAGSIIQKLCLTVRNVVKTCFRKVRRTLFYCSERVRNTVHPSAPRFLRL